MIINLSRIDFGGITGGKSKPEEVFDVQPTTSDQTITPTEGSVFSGGTVRAVTKEIDANIVSNNIKEGVTILGVAGTLKEEKPEERFNVQPTTAEQTITPTAGSVFSGGTVKAVTAEIDANIASNNIKEGITILGVAGTLKEEKPEERFNVQPTTTDQTITPTQGSVFSGGTVHAVTSSIDSNIQPGNIREGVSILGVAGTLSGGSGVFVVPDGTKFSTSTFTELPSNIDTSNVTDMNSMFSGCYNLTAIPQMNTSNVTDMNSMFNGCQQLTAIPQMSTSNVTDMRSMFYYCMELTEIPLLDTSNVLYMNDIFNTCLKLTSIPQLDTSNVTDMSHMFDNCQILTNISQLLTSNVTNMSCMFNNCQHLTEIPLLDTSNVTDMSYMFSSCQNLTGIPLLNTSNVTNMDGMFQDCFNLTTISSIDTSNVRSMDSMFYSCVKLTTVPSLNTSNVTNMNYLFNSCNNLTTVEGIDFSGFTSSPSYMFGYYSGMPNITRFIVNGKINVSISDNYSIKPLTAIDYDSVKSILEAANRTDNTNAKELAFNRTMTDQNGELAALVTSCTSKGWTISGLTLQ